MDKPANRTPIFIRSKTALSLEPASNYLVKISIDYIKIIVKKRIKKLYNSTQYYVYLFLAKVYGFKKQRELWLITHTTERWGDNARALFAYLKDNDPDIDLYAVVDKTDLHLINKKNRLLRNSFKGNIFILLADVLASTHTVRNFGPHALVGASRAKKIWLRHGVIGIKKMYPTVKHNPYDLICVSSEIEKNLLINQLNIANEKLEITGNARHDILKKKSKGSQTRTGILYIPTKRDWLSSSYKDIYEKILFSWIEKFYESISSVPIKIWLHPGWYKRELGNMDMGNVELVDEKQDPQVLLLSTKLLITDYSSVFFDAALCGIPTIFYQPDRSEFINRRGLFQDFVNQNQLLVIEKKDLLLQQINSIFSDDAYYQERLEKDRSWAFLYVETYDGRCCERIFQKIRKLLDNELVNKYVRTVDV